MFELIDDLSPTALSNFSYRSTPSGAHYTIQLSPDGTFKHGMIRDDDGYTIPLNFTPDDEWWDIETSY